MFPFSIYLHNPLCGTCVLAERMIRISEEVGPCMPVFKLNAHLATRLMKQWEIHSVPCLCVWDQGKLLQKITAIRSVDAVYRVIKID